MVGGENAENTIDCFLWWNKLLRVADSGKCSDGGGNAYRRIAKMAERRHWDNRSEPHGFRCACVWKYRCVWHKQPDSGGEICDWTQSLSAGWYSCAEVRWGGIGLSSKIPQYRKNVWVYNFKYENQSPYIQPVFVSCISSFGFWGNERGGRTSCWRAWFFSLLFSGQSGEIKSSYYLRGIPW